MLLIAYLLFRNDIYEENKSYANKNDETILTNTSYSQIKFNSIELFYYPEETSSGFLYTPVWIFSEIDESTNELIELILINATTGSIVEVR